MRTPGARGKDEQPISKYEGVLIHKNVLDYHKEIGDVNNSTKVIKFDDRVMVSVNTDRKET
jgi:hypothetical protein